MRLDVRAKRLIGVAVALLGLALIAWAEFSDAGPAIVGVPVLSGVGGGLLAFGLLLAGVYDRFRPKPPT